ncbi:MAG: 16S rRNA (uracil(1498)-N(3))-methyltransferase [Ruminococcaceae bacterium]|nr:16S rRNA (uracil(1498)-N(3))-methyltransferase [Oscillospiraceae bacterium]
MPRFFVNTDRIIDGKVYLDGDDAHHISHSLRMAEGERITVCDMQAWEYDCVLESFSAQSVTAHITEKRKIESEPPYRAHLYQALPKGDKLDTVIQKAVECGAYDITPFESSRCIVKAKAEAEDKRTERRLRIATEAAKQCGRGILPRVYPTVSFDRMLDSIKACDLVLFCYEGEETVPLGKLLSERLPQLLEGENIPDIAVVIGSEGGFSPEEAERICDLGILPVGLGKRILRTETASGFALACLVLATELS